MPFIWGFAWKFLLANNSSVSEKECGLGFQKDVSHTCRGAGSLSPALQTTFSQLLFMFIKLGFEIFELWLNIFKFQVKFFELLVKLGLKIQTSSQALGTWTQAFGQGGSSFEFSLFLVQCHWTSSQGCSNTQDPFELHIIFLKSKTKKELSFFTAAYKQQNPSQQNIWAWYLPQ